eukprot:621416-Prymnesium_polylepis.1
MAIATLSFGAASEAAASKASVGPVFGTTGARGGRFSSYESVCERFFGEVGGILECVDGGQLRRQTCAIRAHVADGRCWRPRAVPKKKKKIPTGL